MKTTGRNHNDRRRIPAAFLYIRTHTRAVYIRTAYVGEIKNRAYVGRNMTTRENRCAGKVPFAFLRVYDGLLGYVAVPAFLYVGFTRERDLFSS